MGESTVMHRFRYSVTLVFVAQVCSWNVHSSGLLLIDEYDVASIEANAGLGNTLHSSEKMNQNIPQVAEQLTPSFGATNNPAPWTSLNNSISGLVTPWLIEK